MTISPWHMWGGSAAVTLSPQVTTASAQLARIEYHRPESWRFFFYANVVRSFITTPPANIIVAFSVNTGTGRASFLIPAFETFIIQVTLGGEQGQPTNPKFSTAALGPFRSDLASPQVNNIVETIVGQDVQIAYRALLATGGLPPTDQVQMEIGCALAPWHHARPDWFLKNFRGDETDGS